jgi:ABC-type multidrug transport system ATPase subunit
VLFLDEPTTGVDPVSRKEFWGMLKKLKQQGITILVSTPYMDEASICDRIAFIQNGKILSINTSDKIIANFPYEIFAVESGNNYEILKQLRQNPAVRSVFSFGDTLHVVFKGELSPPPSIGGYEHGELSPSPPPPSKEGYESNLNFQFKKISPTIEDCFMALMNE